VTSQEGVVTNMMKKPFNDNNAGFCVHVTFLDKRTMQSVIQTRRKVPVLHQLIGVVEKAVSHKQIAARLFD
jgi:hypothetical protein